jgi:hypothetical protein
MSKKINKDYRFEIPQTDNKSKSTPGDNSEGKGTGPKSNQWTKDLPPDNMSSQPKTTTATPSTPTKKPRNKSINRGGQPHVQPVNDDMFSSKLDQVAGHPSESLSQEELDDLESRGPAFEDREDEDKDAFDDEQRNLDEATDEEDEDDEEEDDEEESGTPLASKLLGSWKKKAIFGASIGIGTGLSLGVLSIMHGPIKALHIANILNSNNAVQELSINRRMKMGLLKNGRYQRGYAKNDIGYTRVGRWGANRYDSLIKEMANKGVTVQRDAIGRPTRYTIDVNRATSLRGSPNSGAANSSLRLISKTFNVSPNQITGGGGVYNIEFDNLTRAEARSLIKTTNAKIEWNEGGSRKNAARLRVMAKFWAAPSLFHPIRAADYKAQSEWVTRTQRLAKETARKTAKQGRLKSKYLGAKQALANKVNPWRTQIVAGLAVTGALCILHDLSDTLSLANYAAILRPGSEEYLDAMSLGSQMAADDDIGNLAQLGASVEAKEDDEGRDWFASKSVNALATNTEGEGEDLDFEYKQAFVFSGGGFTGVYRLFKGEADEDGNPLLRAIDGSADIICSKPGQVVGVVIGGALIWSGGGNLLKAAVRIALSVKGMQKILQYAQELATNAFIAKLTDEMLFQGPSGGGIVAHSGRLVNNINSAAMGGVPLSDEEESSLRRQAYEVDRNRFMQKPLYARIADPLDHRSMVGGMIQTTNPNVTNNLRSMANLLINPFSMLSKTYSRTLSPKAEASAADYDWGFPLVAPSPDLMEKYDDPYENAEAVATLMEDDAIDPAVLERAKTCWGIELRKSDLELDGFSWEVINADEVELNSDEYGEAQCDNLNYFAENGEGAGAASDQHFERLAIFTMDDAIVTAEECLNQHDPENWSDEVEAGGACEKMLESTGTSLLNLGDSLCVVSDIGDETFAFPVDVSKEQISNRGDFNNGRLTTDHGTYEAYDIVVEPGRPVGALTEGVVISVGSGTQYDRCGGMSIQVYTERGDKSFTTTYIHLDPSVVSVGVGDTVEAGKILGVVGTANHGCGTPHLHIDMVTGRGRPGCSRLGCDSADRFIDIGSILYDLYQLLPDTGEGGQALCRLESEGGGSEEESSSLLDDVLPDVIPTP